jgi:hypothetical protein
MRMLVGHRAGFPHTILRWWRRLETSARLYATNSGSQPHSAAVVGSCLELEHRRHWSGNEVRMRSGDPGPDRPRVIGEGPDLIISLTRIVPVQGRAEARLPDVFPLRGGERCSDFSAPRLAACRGARLVATPAVSSASISPAARRQCSSCLPCGCPSASQNA